MATVDWRGVFAVLVTPFHEDLSIDFGGLAQQVDFCVACGVQGIVTPVVASEFFKLSDAERGRIVDVVATRLGGGIPLVAGVAGTSAPHASALAKQARDAGADALIAMPPYVGGTNKAQIFHYYEAIAHAAHLPLMVQNAGPPVGTPLSVEDLIELVERVPEIVAIKQETSPNPQTVGRVVEAGDGRLEGVFGGLGGIYLFNELRRGATGTMPACQFADVAVQVFDLYHAGDEDRARAVYADLQPALVMERLYEMTFMKECLKRRGVIDTAVTRVPEAPMDAADHAELDRIWNALENHFTWHVGK